MYKTLPLLYNLCFFDCFGAVVRRLHACSQRSWNKLNCFHISRKKQTLHTTCACEGSTVICWNTCRHWHIATILAPEYRHRDGAHFCWKSFLVYKYLWWCQDSFRNPGILSVYFCFTKVFSFVCFLCLVFFCFQLNSAVFCFFVFCFCLPSRPLFCFLVFVVFF